MGCKACFKSSRKPTSKTWSAECMSAFKDAIVTTLEVHGTKLGVTHVNGLVVEPKQTLHSLASVHAAAIYKMG